MIQKHANGSVRNPYPAAAFVTATWRNTPGKRNRPIEQNMRWVLKGEILYYCLPYCSAAGAGFVQLFLKANYYSAKGVSYSATGASYGAQGVPYGAKGVSYSAKGASYGAQGVPYYSAKGVPYGAQGVPYGVDQNYYRVKGNACGCLKGMWLFTMRVVV